MPSYLRAILVALVATLGLALVAPSSAEAKPKRTHVTAKSKTVEKTKTTKTSKRIVKRPWAKAHAKPHAKRHHAKPHHAKPGVRTSPAAKHRPQKG